MRCLQDLSPLAPLYAGEIIDAEEYQEAATERQYPLVVGRREDILSSIHAGGDQGIPPKIRSPMAYHEEAGQQ
jgi:hypothetical protein